MRNEFLYFLIIASVISLPYVLLNLFITSSSFPSAETNVHSKISQLQDEINLYLTQQRFLSIIQQNFTLILSKFQNKLSENEETFISFSNYSEQSSNLEQNRVDPQDVSVNLERFQQLKDEILKIRKYLTSSEKTIHDFEKQVLQLDQQTSNLELRSLKVIEEIISNSILEQLHAEVQNHCFSLSVSSHTLCPTLTKSEIVKIVSRLAILLQDKLKNSHSSVESLSSNDYFEFPSVEISQIISNLTSSTYRVAQTGILDSQILPSVGFSPNFIIGGPQEVISDNMALGHCWAMEGTRGTLTVQLSKPVHVAGISVEHISRLAAVDISSAPSILEVYGVSDLGESSSRLLSRIKYDIHSSSLQYFPLPYPTKQRYQYLQIKIIGNHGNPRYTCLYHLKVHGFTL